MRTVVLAAFVMAPALAFAQTPPAAPPPPSASAAAPAWLPRGTAELVLLDKLRSQPQTVEVKAGQSVTFGTLTITLKSCVARPPDRPQNSAAFLVVTDTRGTVPTFQGWILSETPAVNQLQHPVYDLRLVRCR